MVYLLINGKKYEWTNKPDEDHTWNSVDKFRAKTYEMRFRRLGLSIDDCSSYVYIAVMKKKHSGLVYSSDIETRLKTLLIE